ncbi:MBL fold metallo-hydrolase [Paenibacillus sp. N3.4]|uniref:MBL fold metallo-hydrolase n=1 Tax=Paenibacillus sp. N3.4 TaxID=2603222 RepID=UPI0011CC64D3|nr:MBL fold metallo-hydrolase [Paenibacillus sp. N3.4]TXK84784.1 MBL fold metallo-hydrolase [Paenibacillus sp. N3.4]
MMQLNIWGGAGEHGRSCYWIGNESTSILLDCGVKREGCGAYPYVDPSMVSRLDAVFLSHAHEDHSIAIPLLYKLGYQGKVWTTRITAEQLPTYYAAWGNYVRQQGGVLPYDQADIARIEFAYVEDHAPSLQWTELFPKLRICWGRSGHMLGSIWLLLEMDGQQIFYSGDYSEESLLLRADSPKDAPKGLTDVEAAVIDAAYSMDTDGQTEKLEQLYATTDAILAAGGQVLLPVPVSGRGQELILLMQQRFPEIPIRVEQELLLAMEHMIQQPQWLNPDIFRTLADALSSSRYTVIQNESQRTAVMEEAKPSIWFTSDGMMQSAKSQWYYEKLRSHPSNGIIITGHVAKGTLAQRLFHMNEEERGCQMFLIRYKIHQGLPDVRRMISYLPKIPTLLVHAPKSDTDILLEHLKSEGHHHLLSLTYGDRLEI